MLVVGSDGDERLADVDASHGAKGLAEGAAHSSLEWYEDFLKYDKETF